MNNITGETPFFRLLVPVVLGIVANEFIEFLPSAVFFSSIGFLAMLLSFFIPKNNEFRYRWIFGAGVFVFIFSLITFQYKRKTEDSSFGSVVSQGIYKGVVHDIPQEKPRSVRVNTNLMYPVRKKIILYLEKDAESSVLRPGDEILFQAKMQPFKNLGNPDDFDYVRFMKIKGFAGSAYVPAHRWMKTGKSIRSVYTLSQNLRAKALDFYKSFGLNPDEYAFIAALTLGYKSNLSNDLQEAFRASGTAHVLAVSGLHVGIIYLILNMFFSFLGNSGKKFVLKQLLIVLFLWGYAFIAGLPVSVVRAAIMLSIFCLGKAFHREGFSYNSLAAAAFFILVFDPMNLFDVGFQMSFLSVFAILFFKPKLDTLYTPSRRSFLKIRDLFTLSLSAQLGVFPLVLYYFGTFPTYFFVTNLLIVPLIGMAIYAVFPVVFFGILNQLNLAVFHSLFRAMSWALNKLIGLIIHIVYVFESLPCSRITNHYLSFAQVVLLFIVLFVIGRYVIKKRFGYVFVVLGSILVFLFINTYNIVNMTTDRFVVYNRPGVSEMGVVVNNKATPVMRKGNNVLAYSSKRIVRLSENTYRSKISEKTFPVDFLILSEDDSFSMNTLNDYFSPQVVILDSSLSKYAAGRITEECRRLHIKVHDVTQMGAFSINL